MSGGAVAALVTGSGRNIGRAVALELAGRGINVVVHGNRNADAANEVAEAVRGQGVQAAIALGNLAHAATVQRLAREALAAFGTIDVLVNVAAIRPQSEFEVLSLDAWHEVMAVNLHSAFLLAKALVPGMRARRFGRIVHFTGMNAIHGYVGRPHVSASKHALWGMTKALAKELAPDGITVNAVSPGPIATTHPDDPEMARHIETQRARIPLGRLGTTEEVAALCGFLCSPEGGFVSGQMIACNGAAET